MPDQARHGDGVVRVDLAGGVCGRARETQQHCEGRPDGRDRAEGAGDPFPDDDVHVHDFLVVVAVIATATLGTHPDVALKRRGCGYTKARRSPVLSASLVRTSSASGWSRCSRMRSAAAQASLAESRAPRAWWASPRWMRTVASATRSPRARNRSS